MIPFINTATFSGRLARKPEVKEIGDKKVTTVTLVVNNRRKVKGEWTDEAMYVTIEAWGVPATILATADKGQGAVAQGTLYVDQYETKEGEKRQTLRLLASAVGVLEESKREKADSPSDNLEFDNNQATAEADDDEPF